MGNFFSEFSKGLCDFCCVVVVVVVVTCAVRLLARAYLLTLALADDMYVRSVRTFWVLLVPLGSPWSHWSLEEALAKHGQAITRLHTRDFFVSRELIGDRPSRGPKKAGEVTIQGQRRGDTEMKRQERCKEKKNLCAVCRVPSSGGTYVVLRTVLHTRSSTW